MARFHFYQDSSGKELPIRDKDIVTFVADGKGVQLYLRTGLRIWVKNPYADVLERVFPSGAES